MPYVCCKYAICLVAQPKSIEMSVSSIHNVLRSDFISLDMSPVWGDNFNLVWLQVTVRERLTDMDASCEIILYSFSVAWANGGVLTRTSGVNNGHCYPSTVTPTVTPLLPPLKYSMCVITGTSCQ